MDVQFKIEGLPDLQKLLQDLGPAVVNKGARFALRKGANLVGDSAKAGARELDDSGTGRSIADNITVRFSNRTFKRTGDLMFRVGVVGGARLPKGSTDKNARAPSPHWRLLEFGTEKMAARPFMRRALSDNVGEVTSVTSSELNKWIARFVKKQAKS